MTTKSLEFKKIITDAVRDLLTVLKKGYDDVLDTNELSDSSAEALIEVLFDEMEKCELESRSILSSMIEEKNNGILLSEQDLILYKMVTLGKA